MSAWNWQRKSFSVAPPSTRSSAGRRPASAAHRLEHVTRLVRDRLECRPRQVGAGRPAGQPDQGAPRVHVPVGRAEPHEGGHEVDASRVRHRVRQGLGLGRGPDQPEPVSEPLDGGAGDEDRALRGRTRSAGGPPPGGRQRPGHRREEAGLRGDGRRAGVEEKEASRPVRVLRAPPGPGPPDRRGRPAGPRRCRPPECRPADRRGPPSPRRPLPTGGRRGRSRAGCGGGRQLRVPVETPDVEAEGARGVRGIRRVDAPARELPEEPAVHRAERRARRGPRARGARAGHRAATRSWCPRSRRPARGRSGRAPAARGRPLAGARRGAPSAGTARRSPGGPARRCAGPRGAWSPAGW